MDGNRDREEVRGRERERERGRERSGNGDRELAAQFNMMAKKSCDCSLFESSTYKTW